MPGRRASAGSTGLLIREAEAISGGALALFLALSLLSYTPDAPHANLGGPVGHAIADTALHALGLAAYLFPLYLGYVTVTLMRPGTEDLSGLRLAGAGLLIVTLAGLAGLVTEGRAIVRGGGWLGGFVGTALRELVGGPGGYLALTGLLAVALMLATGVSAIAVTTRLARQLAATGTRLAAAGLRRAGRLPMAREPGPRIRKPILLTTRSRRRRRPPRPHRRSSASPSGSRRPRARGSGAPRPRRSSSRPTATGCRRSGSSISRPGPRSRSTRPRCSRARASSRRSSRTSASSARWSRCVPAR